MSARGWRLLALIVAAVLLCVLGQPSAAFADTVRDMQWHLRFLDVAKAQQVSQGAGVLVGVVDAGVDATHPDLAGNVLPGTDVFVGSNGGDGWTDTDGHGTRMAGLIAGHGHGPGNADGILGIAPQAKILPARVGTSGFGGLTDIPDGITWTADHGARVISISAGSSNHTHDLDRAINTALARDIVVVAGAGNVSQGDNAVIYPAAYPGVVAVGGVDQNGNHSRDSVTGAQLVLSAPSVDITTAGLNHRYGRSSGTSDATAIVAGAAALVRAKFPNLSAAEVIHRLTATAIDKGPPGRDDQYGYGIVNLVGALTADVPPLSPSPSASHAPSAPNPPAAAPPASGSSTKWPLIGAGIVLIVLLAAGGVILTLRRPSAP